MLHEILAYACTANIKKDQNVLRKYLHNSLPTIICVFLYFASLSLGNVSVNPSTSDGGTFTTESSTVQQGKVFFSPLAPSAVVYTVPNSGQAVGSVKQEGLERSLVFSQLMPVSQNTQLNVNMSSENKIGRAHV